MEKTPEILSFGGGVNSTAMLIGMQERGERPDVILFADTGGEKPETYAHVVAMNEWCKLKGFPEIETVRKQMTLEADCLARESLPSKAFGFGTCSERFKLQPQRTWLRDHNIEKGVATWIVGIHAGETRRAKRDRNDFGEKIRYPLIEWGWSQEDCESAIVRIGMKTPIKSACFFCPSMRKVEVIQLSKTHPDLFQRAIEMESAAIEAGEMTTCKGLGRHWTWEALVKSDDLQLRLFDDTQSPMCDVCVDW